MRVLGITVLGTALIAGGLVAPAAGRATAGGGKISFNPRVAQPGQSVEIAVAGCSVGRERHTASSKAFTGQVTLGGKAAAGYGTAHIRPGLRDGSYNVVAHCGSRKATGRLKISSQRSWSELLPTRLNPQTARASELKG
ncbi:hypothetical protein [Spirillospora sp. CA-294931]|uniref:hypothetical protein n=1 Tax=Spirillospora sp. CA-294931 TaxID=3240042 RepID=UPI003D8B059E